MTLTNSDDWMVTIAPVFGEPWGRDEESFAMFQAMDEHNDISVATAAGWTARDTFFDNRVILHHDGGTVWGMPTQHFLYMDCGLWAGDGGEGHYPRHRDFGVVYGNWAALCSFEAAGHGGGIPVPAPAEAGHAFDDELADLNALLQALTGPDNRVRVVKAMRHVGPNARTARPQHGFLFIPDMHMPLLDGHGQGDTSSVPAHGRLGYGGDPSRSRDWLTYYGGADMFEHAGVDLIELLNRAEAFERYAVTMVQLGDMVDLWIGFDPWFQPQPASAPRVVPIAGTRETVDYWLARAANDFDLRLQNRVELGASGNLMENAFLIREMHNLPGRKIWIYGNHDCYLSVLTPHPLPGRVPYFTEDRLLVEHGHQGDPYNRDGASPATFGQFRSPGPGGQWITNRVFQAPGLRSVESLVSDVRAGPLKWAAWSFLQRARRNDPFSIFVMGHTHTRGLGRVHVLG